MDEPKSDGRGSAPYARTKVRVESLSDLVFGLALSIGSLFLIDRMPQNGSDLAENVALFGFGFFIIVQTWLGYSRTMSVLPMEVPYALAANLGLLFVVAIEPYLFYVLVLATTDALAAASSAIYALDLGGMFLLQGVLARMVVVENRSLAHGQHALNERLIRRFRLVTIGDAVAGTVFVVSALPFFWVASPFLGEVRFDMWTASLCFLWVMVSRRIRS